MLLKNGFQDKSIFKSYLFQNISLSNHYRNGHYGNSHYDRMHNSFIYDLDTDSDTSIRVKLNIKQKDVMNFCSVSRSNKEILERVGVSYHTKNIDKYINYFVNTGYLEMTNPENPNAIIIPLLYLQISPTLYLYMPRLFLLVYTVYTSRHRIL